MSVCARGCGRLIAACILASIPSCPAGDIKGVTWSAPLVRTCSNASSITDPPPVRVPAVLRVSRILSGCASSLQLLEPVCAHMIWSHSQVGPCNPSTSKTSPLVPPHHPSSVRPRYSRPCALPFHPALTGGIECARAHPCWPTESHPPSYYLGHERIARHRPSRFVRSIPSRHRFASGGNAAFASQAGRANSRFGFKVLSVSSLLSPFACQSGSPAGTVPAQTSCVRPPPVPY